MEQELIETSSAKCSRRKREHGDTDGRCGDGHDTRESCPLRSAHCGALVACRLLHVLLRNTHVFPHERLRRVIPPPVPGMMHATIPTLLGSIFASERNLLGADHRIVHDLSPAPSYLFPSTLHEVDFLVAPIPGNHSRGVVCTSSGLVLASNAGWHQTAVPPLSGNSVLRLT